MKTADSIDGCSGCLEYDREYAQCAHVPEMIRDMCPCKNCLIKMICGNVCPIFKTFLSTEAEREWFLEKKRNASM